MLVVEKLVLSQPAGMNGISRDMNLTCTALQTVTMNTNDWNMLEPMFFCEAGYLIIDTI